MKSNLVYIKRNPVSEDYLEVSMKFNSLDGLIDFDDFFNMPHLVSGRNPDPSFMDRHYPNVIEYRGVTMIFNDDELIDAVLYESKLYKVMYGDDNSQENKS